jgi:large subunit ribosomal protein L15
MELHSLSNTTGARKKRIRVGRGMRSGKGKTSGKGHKGQLARKGHKNKSGFEGGQMRLVRRIPKRGFKNPTATTYLSVNIEDLSRFEAGSVVSAAELRRRGLAKGPADGVKILGRGELAKKLTVQAQAFSASARVKIEAAGGACEVVRK